MVHSTIFPPTKQTRGTLIQNPYPRILILITEFYQYRKISLTNELLAFRFKSDTILQGESEYRAKKSASELFVEMFQQASKEKKVELKK